MSPVCRMVSFCAGPPAPAAPEVPPPPPAPPPTPAPPLPPAGLLTPQPATLHAPASEAANSARNIHDDRRACRRQDSAPDPAPVSALVDEADVPRVAPCQLTMGNPFLEVGSPVTWAHPPAAHRPIRKRSLAKIIPFRRLRECRRDLKRTPLGNRA